MHFNETEATETEATETEGTDPRELSFTLRKE